MHLELLVGTATVMCSVLFINHSCKTLVVRHHTLTSLCRIVTRQTYCIISPMSTATSRLDRSCMWVRVALWYVMLVPQLQLLL